MAEHIADEELSRAEENLKRLLAYFSMRISWQAGGDGAEALEAARRSTTTLLQTLADNMQQAGIMLPKGMQRKQRDQQPAAAFEAAKVLRFSQFLEQLDRWFVSRAGYTTSPAGARTVQTVYAIALSIKDDLSSIIDGPPEEPEPAPAAQPAKPAGPTAVPPKRAKLKMENTTEQPLIDELKGKNELSNHAKDMLSTFLTENEIEMSDAEQRHFEGKVVGWLESTPESSMLVIKIGGLHGRYKPFPSYAVKQQPEEIE